MEGFFITHNGQYLYDLVVPPEACNLFTPFGYGMFVNVWSKDIIGYF